MNENINLKLDNFNQKDTEYDNLFKELIEEMKTLKSNNEMYLKMIDELKTSVENVMSKLKSIEERHQTIEDNEIDTSAQSNIKKIDIKVTFFNYIIINFQAYIEISICIVIIW